MKSMMLAFALIIFFSAQFAKAEPPSPDGRYKVAAYMEKCNLKGFKLCAVINKGLRSERRLAVAPSEWNSRLTALTGVKGAIQMVGTIKEGVFTPESKPALQLPSADDVVGDPNRATPL